VAALFPLAVLALLAAGCGGSGGGSPTDPGMPPPAASSASIQGQVTAPGSTTGGLTAGGQEPTPVTAQDSTGAGVVIRVQGTGLSTTADGDGNFALQGVPAGNQTLVFETSQSAAGLPIPGIRPGETIRLSVTVEGTNARVTDMDREGGEAEDEEDEGEDDEGDEGADELELSLQLSPDTWNLSYEHSAGTVAAFIRGPGFRDVVLDSIVLVGDDDTAEPLEPVATPTRQGNNVRARFAKSDVLDLLDEPENGSMHTVALLFEVDGVDELQELTAEVRIVGPDDGEDDEGEEEEEEEDEELGNLSLQLSPDAWNTNWDRANGHVTAFIRGDGLGAIDTDSIELVGDNPEADPLPADFARLEGNHVRAQFPKGEVLDLLDDPDPGETHTVTVRFTSDGGAEAHELTADVRIVGKKD
jgi:hypothetical protein